jgi:tetratricopeptide (TPR) repeat protein
MKPPQVTTRDPRELVARGYQCLQSGRLDEAEQFGRRALAAAPDRPEVLTMLAIVLQARGRSPEAVPLLEQLVKLQPGLAPHWSNLGTVLRAAGKLDDALKAYEQAAALGARGVDFLYNVGLLHIDLGEYATAHLVLQDAHRQSPRDAEICFRYAAVCGELADTRSAIEALAAWPAFTGLTTELAAKIGGLLVVLGAADRAEAAIARALADPNPPLSASLELVLTLERANRVDEAEALLRRIPPQVASIPELDVLLLLAQARLAQRRGEHEAAVALFRRLIDEKSDEPRRHLHLYPLFKSLDQLGRHDEAFEAALQAHASQTLWTGQVAPTVGAGESALLRATQAGCDAADVARWDHAGAPSFLESPVFIVAFPRSGTTLLEQVLDAHPRLQSMDEQPYLQNAIEKLGVDGAHYPDRMASLSPGQIAAARDYYWSLVRQHVELAPGQQLLDKNPLNILRLPAIVRLFPNARILLAVRHPCDVVLSCFTQHFRNEFAWDCRDLHTLAHTYRRTMDFWHQQAALLLPTQREVRYERLVTDFETEVRALAEFLELPWVDAMLEPGAHAQRKGYIGTPSYAQVVQPVHQRAVDRWRAYARQLAPAVPELHPYLERWDYEAPVQPQGDPR